MKLNFCPECAALLVKITDTKFQCSHGHPFYNNPRGACSLVFLDSKGRLLYAKRAHAPAKGKYDLPGGFLDYDEDAYQAAQREAREEMGITVAASDLELIDCSQNTYQENISACDFVFLCHKWQGKIRPGDDVASLEWKPLAFLHSPAFAWKYPRLYDKLQEIIIHVS